jgi:hypothetical protein
MHPPGWSLTITITHSQFPFANDDDDGHECMRRRNLWLGKITTWGDRATLNAKETINGRNNALQLSFQFPQIIHSILLSTWT